MYKIPKHTQCAIDVTHRFSTIGLAPIILQKIGTFAVTWGLFESTLERAVWVVKKEDVRGKRPSTDKIPPSQWLIAFGRGSSDLSPGANEVLRLAAEAAVDLMDYRHSLMHGTLVAFPGSSWFMRNTQWHDVVRNKPFGDAHVDDNLLDLAVETAWILYKVVLSVAKFPESEGVDAEIALMRSDVLRAKSSANELRHLSKLINHEKY
jgi:hypothetical protein